MPNQKFNLSSIEEILGAIVCLVFIAITVLALCLAGILPKRLPPGNSHKSCENDEVSCKCESTLLIATVTQNCVPRAFRKFSTRIATSGDSHASCDAIENYPYLVSLNDESERFVCSGTILSRNWVLVGNDCDFANNELFAFRLRAGSSYWVKGGSEHSLVESIQFNELIYAVKIIPPFQYTEQVQKVGYRETLLNVPWSGAVSVGWRKDLAKKNDKFNINGWSKVPCAINDCKLGIVTDEVFCDRWVNGRALVDNERYLVGFHVAICNDTYIYVNFQDARYINWFNSLLEIYDNPHSLDRETTTAVASESLKIYSTKSVIC